ncbi:MAG TPA: TIM barrel protein [bacterium]|nr:TIM barrel protein [bacterium]HQO33486.1 TIM barrel protein [bacterium]HQP96851.1 TIM barrel protein [bacterium]
MPTLSVCIEAFWGKDPLEQRIRKTASLGFKAFEFWGWRGKDLDAIRKAKEETGLQLATFCMESEKPLVDPTGGDALIAGLKESISVAKSLGCDCLLLTTGNARADERFEVTWRTAVRHLKRMAPILEEQGVTLVIEPLNPIVDHIGYWLTRMSDAADLCREVNSPQVKILMDFYHQQITEGNLIANLRQYAPLIGHFHCGGVPGRHELTGCEIDYRSVFKAIDETGYRRYAGLEFWPTGDTEQALRQALDLAGA